MWHYQDCNNKDYAFIVSAAIFLPDIIAIALIGFHIFANGQIKIDSLISDLTMYFYFLWQNKGSWENQFPWKKLLTLIFTTSPDIFFSKHQNFRIYFVFSDFSEHNNINNHSDGAAEEDVFSPVRNGIFVYSYNYAHFFSSFANSHKYWDLAYKRTNLIPILYKQEFELIMVKGVATRVC